MPTYVEGKGKGGIIVNPPEETVKTEEPTEKQPTTKRPTITEEPREKVI